MRTNILTNDLKCFNSIPGNCRLNLGHWEEKAWARLDLEPNIYI